MTIQQQINKMLDEASSLAVKEVERFARKAMRRYPRCKSFCMAMGGASFYDSQKEPIEEGHACYSELYNFLYGGEGVNNFLKVTGNPVKIIGASGVVITDW